MHTGKFKAGMEKDLEPGKCEIQRKPGWTLVLQGDGGRLGGKMEKPPCKKTRPTSCATLASVDSDRWPSQAHHLIPHQQLAKHEVTQWLAESPKGGLEQMIYADNDYDVDNCRNGKWMPYVSSLSDWTRAGTKRKQTLANKVMAAAGIQLHQGKHSFEPYGTSDTGYKTRVDEYLKLIIANSQKHDKGCDDCEKKAKADKKAGLLPPRRNVSRYLDQTSVLLDGDVNRCEIFVSARAHEYHAAFGNPADAAGD